MIDAGDRYLDSDAVFGVRDSLVVAFTPDPATPGGLLADFDLKLARA